MGFPELAEPTPPLFGQLRDNFVRKLHMQQNSMNLTAIKNHSDSLKYSKVIFYMTKSLEIAPTVLTVPNIMDVALLTRV